MSEEKKQPYRKLNYKRSLPDDRDFPYKHLMRLERQAPLPPKVDLTEKDYYPDVYDQGQLGSCTAQAAAACKEFITRKYVKDYPSVSRLGFYYSEREAQGDVKDDTGSDGRTSAEVMLAIGVGSEKLWPYDEAKFAVRPPQEYFAEGKLHKIGAYYNMTSVYQLQKCLAAGFPFVLGIYCPKQLFEDDFTGYCKSLPLSDAVVENGQLAGHQVSCFGYETINDTLYFKLRNSWGVNFGLKGHFYMSADMMMSEWVADFYTYRLSHEPGI